MSKTPVKRVTLKTRVHGLYSAMKKRFGPKYWASGPRKGQLREPGQELPFTEQEFLYVAQVAFPDNRAIPCTYCRTPIDAFSASWDHERPVSRGGSLQLSNLEPICDTCNRVKGSLIGWEFRELLDWLDTLQPAAQQDVLSRLKAGAMGLRLRYYGKRR